MSKVSGVLAMLGAIDPADVHVEAPLLELAHHRQQGFTLFAIHGSFARTALAGQTGLRRAPRSVRGK